MADPSCSAPAAALTESEQLRYAVEIIQMEANSLLELAGRLDQHFLPAVQLLYRCSGSVIVSGMGKAGLIGQKIAATLASTGTPSHYLHPGEAVHGDLGRIHQGDVVLLLSQSGETEEIVRLLPSLAELGVAMLAITSRAHSSLGRAATVTLELGPLQEACALGLAPSTSTTAMLALGDALALVTSRMRAFGREDFARFHPGGALGRQLSKVEHHMRPLAECRVVPTTRTVRQVFAASPLTGRRTGAIMVTGAEGKLVGVFTDSDLARLFERRRDSALDGPIAEVMTRNPRKVPLGSMMNDALLIMSEHKISELPVIDAGSGCPLGLIDITDVGIQWVQEVAKTAPAAGPASNAHGVPRPILADTFAQSQIHLTLPQSAH